ncbi:hypothetical protein AB0B01_00300 [Streptomyces sp. NPDC044571]|uniref:hypothetical protein n=1 Tax=Streptomyces sp. NPDC044571 TaxID=3155371 RepID=UPI00340DCB0F
METATSLAIGQLSDYLRGLAQRLDPGSGWYGEFLRRDPEGVRACLEGAAMPPWDVVESLLGDLARDRGAEFAERERQYAARLRTAAVSAWDRLPGGAEELRTLLAAAAEQRAAAEAAVRALAERLAALPAGAEAEALSRELTWTRDDASRATSREADLASRLTALHPGPAPSAPEAPPGQGPDLPGAPTGPAWSRPAPAGSAAPAATPDPEQPWPGPGLPPGDREQPRPGPAFAGAAPVRPAPEPGGSGAFAAPEPARADGGTAAGEPGPEALPGVPRQRSGDAGDRVPQPPVRRAEGRWLRGERRSGGARYAGAAAPEAPVFTPPPGYPAESAPPRGARFGRPDRTPEPPHSEPPSPATPADPGPATAWAAAAASAGPGAEAAWPPAPGSPAPGTAWPDGSAEPGSGRAWPDGSAGGPGAGVASGSGRAVGAVVGELLALRGQGRGGEAHALLCEAAAWPAERLPGLADALARAGLGADWATLLWEAASLPPEQLAAAAAALAEAGRTADCETLLRQGVARPTAEIADAALALAEAGRSREADALLGAFVLVRTPQEAAGLARRAPQWFGPRLLRAAEALSDSRRRDLVHALRVAKLPAS